ncbi:M16 family metallopeptidase [Ventosimonas gracilis]|nr:pitrilysin family protein [Ventosimonas gracilis]
MIKPLALVLALTALLVGCPSHNGAKLQSLAKLSEQPPVTARMDIQQWRTSGGTRVLFVSNRWLEMLDVRLIFAAGSSRDPQDKAGLALLTNALLGEGTELKDANAIAQGFDQLGAEFSTSSHRDMAIVSLRSISNDPYRRSIERNEREQCQPTHLARSLLLLTEVLGQPTFPEDALARIKNQLRAGFEHDKQNPGKQARTLLFKRLYGEHPYGHPSEGTEQSIAAITQADVQDFYQQAYNASNAVIVLVGNADDATAKYIAEQIASALPQGQKLPELPAPATPTAGKSHIEYPSQQTHLLLASLGIKRSDPDYAALYLGNQILGGGFGSRLTEEVREKRGLTYGIYSAFTPMAAPGPFIISVQTKAQQSEGTLELVQQILADFIANGPTEQELAAAKRELFGSFPLTLMSNADIAGQLGAIGFYDLPLDQLERFMQQVKQVSIEDIKAAFARHLDAEQLVIVSAGPTTGQQPLPPPGERIERVMPVPEH